MWSPLSRTSSVRRKGAHAGRPYNPKGPRFSAGHGVHRSKMKTILCASAVNLPSVQRRFPLDMGFILHLPRPRPAHYLISRLSSLNSGVPARPSHSNSTISVVATSTPFSRSRCRAASRLAGVRDEMASATTTVS
jgi:hypothetical protein